MRPACCCPRTGLQTIGRLSLLLAAMMPLAGGTARRSLQAEPKELLLPFPSTSGCLHDCKLRIPASAFPAEMTAHESQEQARMLSTRYTEFLADLQRAYGKPPDEKPSATEFIVYCRQQAHESAALIDGEQRCNVAESGPGALHHSIQRMSVTPSCLTWLQLYKVFLHYEQVESSWRWPQQLPGVANGWCAQNTIPQGGACPVEGTCWPGCVEAIGVPQEGLVPEWCLPWPSCAGSHAQGDTTGGDAYARGSVSAPLTAANLVITMLCGSCATLGLVRLASFCKRRRGKRYARVPVMENVELATDFAEDGDDQYVESDEASSQAIAPTSG